MGIFKKIGNGSNNVLIGHPIMVTEKLNEILKENNVSLFYISEEYYQKFYNSIPKLRTSIGMVMPAYNLDNVYRSKEYRAVMDELVSEIRLCKITHVILNSNMWHEKYLSDLKKEGVVLTTKIVDDPEGSKYYSEPVVKYYDKCVCSGVDYNKKQTIKEMYLKWGAKNVKFLPVFVNPKHYDELPIDYTKKDIDIIHVGSFNWKRWLSLSRLYKKFGNKIKFYSHYDPRKNSSLNGLIYKAINFFFPLPEVSAISDDELKGIYKRSKIGFNRHLSYGPSNARSYELCLNGVMQITDNPVGYREIYDTDSEIKCYNNINGAIKLIEYYLNCNIERELIAKAGHKKAIKCYTYEEIFNKHLKYILE